MGNDNFDVARGQRVKALRGRCSQIAIAEQIGISQSALHKIEKGGGTTYWPQISKVLGASAEFLLYGNPDDAPIKPESFASDLVMPAIELLRKYDRLGMLDKEKVAYIMQTIRYVAGVPSTT